MRLKMRITIRRARKKSQMMVRRTCGISVRLEIKSGVTSR